MKRICRTDKLDLSLGLLRLVWEGIGIEVILIESHNSWENAYLESYNKTLPENRITRKLFDSLHKVKMRMILW